MVPSVCKSIFSITYLSLSFLILISMPNFITPTSSSYICLLLFQIIKKYINFGIVTDCLFAWILLSAICEFSPHLLPVCFLMDSHIWRIFFYYHFGVCESPKYVSQGIFCKFLSRVIWECPFCKEGWAFLFCKCKSMPQETYIQMHKAFKCLILTELLSLMDKISNDCGESTLLKNLMS